MNIRLAVAFTMATTLRRLANASLILVTVSTASVHAQEVGAPQAVGESVPTQIVEIKPTTKNPAMMPYRKAYDLLSKADEAGGHRLHAVFRVTSPQSHQALPDLRVAIEGERTHKQVSVTDAGVVVVPFDQAAYAEDADLVANKPKERLDVGFLLVPEFSAGEIHFVDLAEAVSAAHSAIGKIVPWYMRLVRPSIKGVGLCYRDEGHSVSITAVPEQKRPARQPDVDLAGDKVFCARFSAEEALANRRVVLVPPDGWEAIFW